MCPTLTVGSFFLFFRHVRPTFLFICSTTSNLNNSNLKSASKTKRRYKTDVQNLGITLRIPHSPTFFRHYATIFETFWIHKRVPFICFDILQQWMSKNPQGSPFLHMTKSMCIAVQLRKFFRNSQLHNERLLDKSQNP